MGYLWEQLFFGRNMGYETTALVAVDDSYGVVDWGEWNHLITETYIEKTHTVYRFGWDKRTYLAVQYFLEEVAKKDMSSEDGYEFYDNESFGIIEMGEDFDDIETHGDYWDYDIEVNRSLDVY